MIRNHKTFGLALVAVVALCAFAAQGASASPLTCEVGVNGICFLTGDQDGGTHTFGTAHGTVTCTATTYVASKVVEANGAIRELTVTPTTSGCTAFGFAGSDVKTNGCTYTFTTPTLIKAGEVTWSGESIHILCETGKAIEVTPTTFGVSVCTLKIAPQTPTGGHIVGKNVTGSSPMDITLEFTLTGIHYTGSQSNNSGPCTNSETHTEGTWNGKSTFKCYNNLAHTVQTACTFS